MTKVITQRFIVTCAKDLTPLLCEELTRCALNVLASDDTTVEVQGSTKEAYIVCLNSRLASRVLMPIGEVKALVDEAEKDHWYRAFRAVPWHQHIRDEATFAIRVISDNAKANTQYLAQIAKDGIVDGFRQQGLARPTVSRRQPDVAILAHHADDQIQLYIDFAGEALHKRFYREAQAKASIRPSLAAAMTYLSPKKGVFIDPFCGAGTLLIEAAMIHAGMAPGLARDYWGFKGWRGHDEALWQQLRENAAALPSIDDLPKFIGCDADPDAIKLARENAQRAGVEQWIHFEAHDLAHQPWFKWLGKRSAEETVVITNPPYGERLLEREQAFYLYRALGDKIMAHQPGAFVTLVAAQVEHLDAAYLPTQKSQRWFNGTMPIYVRATRLPDTPEQATLAILCPTAEGVARCESHAAVALANRVLKNYRQLKKWIKAEGVENYRIYDADLPEYNVAVDIYGQYLHVQEYAPPKSVDPKKAAARLQDAVQVLKLAFDVHHESVFLKVRSRQRGKEQYQKKNAKTSTSLYVVREDNVRVLVNMRDYLDTGLFLDHRPIRQRLFSLAKNKRFLNLYGYTGVASLHAAMGGAKSTCTVDMSATYLDWYRKNLSLNGLSEDKHRIVRADCQSWLEKSRQQFDLIFLDPPTFSNSKRLKDHMDIQRDHVKLIQLAMKRLERKGLLIFSNNYKRFTLDDSVSAQYDVVDISESSVPLDFKRAKRIHQCWEIRYKG